jgi:subtilisin family serine protease
MKKFTLCLSLILSTILVSAQSNYKMQSNVSSKDYLPNTIIFKVKEDHRSSCSEQSVNIASLQTGLNNIGVTSVFKKFRNEQPPRNKYNRDGLPLADLSLIYECKFTSNISVESAINILLSSKALVYAEPHFVPVITYTPNDPQATSSGQYHLGRINAYNGWNISQGDTNVVVGITDTGVELTHSDLPGNIKYNYADPINGIDDDLDGFVDNFRGWDVGMNDNDPTWQGDAHGVHVCGIAGATTDNSVGIAGVGFKCKFLPVKIADAAGALIGAYDGIKYAADHGCKVINCSWGSAGGGQFGQDIITYATINKDVLVVCAAGNNGNEVEFFPAAYQYAFAVANTMSTDILNFGSTRGYFVDVSAPGTNINSTYPPGGYTQSTGTSMSAPVVAGLAGIVKSFYPSYSALQIGERIKQTTDNIYGLFYNNSSANKDKLGTGRVNMFRALNDPLAPAVVYSQLQFDDGNDDIFIGNDTLKIGGLFTNYLAPTTALTATLIPLSTGVTAISNTLTIGTLGMMSSISNTATPFSFKLSGTFAPNTILTFSLVMKDGTYTGRDVIKVLANVDYYNIAVNDISTSATSKGKIFYSDDGRTQGLGFLYKGENLIWDGGLMIGTDTGHVSDCIRGTAANDADFNILTNIQRITAAPKSDLDTYTKFGDASSAKPIGIEVEQNTWAWNTSADKKYVIWEYIIKNNSANTYTTLYAGICADWDITEAAGTYSLNKSGYDALNKLGYSWCTNTGGKYAGVKLLTNHAPANFYAMDNVTGGGGGINAYDGFGTDEKYLTLSTGRTSSGNTTANGNDVMNVMSSGPYTIAPGQYIVVAFALIAGDSLLDLQTSAAAAQVKYNGVASPISVKEITLGDNKVLVYPNPATDRINIVLSQKEESEVQVYDQTGRLIHKEKLSDSTGINTQNWSRGIYFVKVNGKEFSGTTKIVLH